MKLGYIAIGHLGTTLHLNNPDKPPRKQLLDRLGASHAHKMYVDNKRVRIVYRIFENKIIVEVVAIGERDGMDVYENTAEKLK